jgi:chromosome segregation ATPase
MSNSPYQYAFYPPPFTSTTAPFVLPEAIVRSGPPGTEDERKMLLEKVSSVLPDINRLLHYYQESQGLLSEKDHLVKQAETQHEEAMNKMRIELIVTKEEYERIIGEQATENLRLKSHSSEQAERIAVLNGLKEEVAALQTKSESMNMELEAEKASYEELKTQKQELEAEVENLRNEATRNHTEHQRLVENLKDEQGKRLAEQEDNHNKALNEQKANLSKIQLDLAGMITKHTQQKKELDSARSVISELESLVAARSKDLDDALDLRRKELGDAERASEEKAEQHKHEIRLSAERLAGITTERRAEVDALNASHQKEIEQFQKAAHEERSKLTATFERCETQLQIELDAAQAAMEELRRELDKERDAHRGVEAELTAERDAHDVLKADHGAANKHHAELAESMLSLRSKQAEWQRESERMDRILQSLGQINAHKTRGKGDQFL